MKKRQMKGQVPITIFSYVEVAAAELMGEGERKVLNRKRKEEVCARTSLICDISTMGGKGKKRGGSIGNNYLTFHPKEGKRGAHGGKRKI